MLNMWKWVGTEIDGTHLKIGFPELASFNLK